MANQIDPRIHTSGSKFAESAATGANRGFRWGLLGAIAGALIVPAVGALAGFALLEIPVIGATLAAVSFIPATLFLATAGGIIGAAYGMASGASDGSEKAAKEDLAARFELSKAETMARIQQQRMAQAGPAMVPQAYAPAYAPAPIPMAAPANENFIVANSNIMASTIAHQNTLTGPALAAARGVE